MSNIIRHFEKGIVKNVSLIQGHVDELDTDYFINKIEEGIAQYDNLNGQTNVKGKMTSFKFFNEDKEFHKILDYLRDDLPIPVQKCRLDDSWGIKCEKGDYTSTHEHNTMWSGIVYLNDNDTPLCFPELNLEVKPRKNEYFFFNGIIKHGTSPLKDGPKYAIPFNLIEVKEWDK